MFIKYTDVRIDKIYKIGEEEKNEEQEEKNEEQEEKEIIEN